jgi:hypothetical protein
MTQQIKQIKAMKNLQLSILYYSLVVIVASIVGHKI